MNIKHLYCGPITKIDKNRISVICDICNQPRILKNTSPKKISARCRQCADDILREEGQLMRDKGFDIICTDCQSPYNMPYSTYMSNKTRNKPNKCISCAYQRIKHKRPPKRRHYCNKPKNLNRSLRTWGCADATCNKQVIDAKAAYKLSISRVTKAIKPAKAIQRVNRDADIAVKAKQIKRKEKLSPKVTSTNKIFNSKQIITTSERLMIDKFLAKQKEQT